MHVYKQLHSSSHPETNKYCNDIELCCVLYDTFGCTLA